MQNNYQPKPGDRVVVEDGVRGKVISVNASRRNATIFIDEEKNVVASWEDLVPLDAEEPAKKSAEIAPAEVKETPPPPVERERPRKNPPKSPPKNSPRQERQETPRTTNLFDNRSGKPAKNSRPPQSKSSKKSKRAPKK